MQRHDPMDELVRRAHERAPGAPSGFAGRLHARISAGHTQQRRARVIYIQSAIAVAAVVILALTIGLNPQWFVPVQGNVETQPQAKSGPEQPAPKANTPVQEPQPQPKPDNSAELAPAPEPKQPDIQPEPTPEPTPEPKKPDDSVEQPQPELEPKKPDDVVEDPQPKEPEDTTPTPDNPAERLLVATLLSVDAKVQVRYGKEAWRDWVSGESLYSGVHLSTGRAAIDLNLHGGGLARFDGEIGLTAEASGLKFDLVKDSIYIDNLGADNAVTVSADGHTAAMPDGVCFVIVDRNGVEAACLHGSLTLDGTTVEAGTYRKATARGVGDAKVFKGDGMLKNLPARVLLREDFEQAPPGGMYEEGERLEEGVAVCDRQPGHIAFRYNPTLTVLPGTVLRVRLRATDVNRLELELFTQPDLKLLKRNKEIMFKRIFRPDGDDWQVFEFKLADITEKDNPDRKIEPGDLLRNFKLHFTGKKLEIDWVEYVRVQE